MPYNADLIMVAGADGRVMFRPADGVETWGHKYEVSKRPKRRPCAPLPYCLRDGAADGVAALLMPSHVAAEAMPMMAADLRRPDGLSWRDDTTIWLVAQQPPEAPKPVAPMPLPAPGLMMLAALLGIAANQRRAKWNSPSSSMIGFASDQA